MKSIQLPQLTGDKSYWKSYSTILNPEDNGGEAITLRVDVYRNGDGEVYTNAILEANSYGASHVAFGIYGPGFASLREAVEQIGRELDHDKISSHE